MKITTTGVVAAALVALAAGCSSSDSPSVAKTSFSPPSRAVSSPSSSSPASSSAAATSDSPAATATSSTSAPSSTAAQASSSAPAPAAPPLDRDATSRRINAGKISMKGFKTTVDYRTKSTGDAAKDSALLAFGDHWRAVIQALEKQDATWPALAQTSAGPALAVQRDYVARDTKRRVGSTGVLRLFSSAANPVPARAGAPRSMTVVSCGNEREWLSLNLRTGKTLANDPEDNLNYETSATVTETTPGVWKVTAFGKTIYGSGRCA